jgi:Ca2+/H+ antiporter, TMEM165/GDT1 family
MLTVLAATYGAVLLAEIAGDKLLFVTGVLATRYRLLPVIAGVAVAFMAKMAVAVAVGNSLVAAISALSFFTIAYSLWRKTDDDDDLTEKTATKKNPIHSAAGGALAAFAAVFFSEWGDIGQITAATIAARTGMPGVVWFAAVAAMLTKAILAALLGAGLLKGLRGRVPFPVVRYCGVALSFVLGILSITVRESR